MTLLERIPRETFHEGSIPVLETKRLALRAPRLGDAKTVATLANDRRIAENTARIPHPYKMSDAEGFIAGANKANPLATVLSVGMMFRYTFGREDLASRIEAAVRKALAAGLRTGDIASPGEAVIGTRELGDAVVAALRT